MAARSPSNTKRGPKGTTIRYEHGRVKVVATRGHRWSDAAETLFLDALAASANVTSAAEAAGFSTVAIYARRRRDAAFAARWAAAVQEGVARLEVALVRAAADTMEGLEFDSDAPIPRMTVAEATNLWRLHRDQAAGRRDSHPGPAVRLRTMDELRDGIVRKIEAIKATRGLPPAERAAILGQTPPGSDG